MIGGMKFDRVGPMAEAVERTQLWRIAVGQAERS